MASGIMYETSTKKANFFKVRLIIVIMATFCPVVCYISRQNLAIAIVSMVENSSPSSSKLAETSTISSNNHTATTLKEKAIACPVKLIIGEDGTSSQEIPTTISSYGPKYDWDSSDKSLIFQSFFLTYVICQIPGARVAEKFGAKWVLATATIGSSFISLISPWAASQHLYLFAFVRVILGICQAALYPACYVLYTAWLPPNERSRALPILVVGAYVGSIIASTATGYFSEQEAFGWEWAFYMPFIVCAIWSIVWIYVGANSPREHRFISVSELEYIELHMEPRDSSVETKKDPSWIKIFTSQHIWALIAAFLATNWAFTIILLLLPSYLNDILLIPPFKNGLINSVIYVLFCISSPIVGMVSSYMIETRPFKVSRLNTRKFFECTAIFGQAACFVILPFLGCNTSIVLSLLYVQIILFSFVNGGEVHLPSELSHDFAGTIYAIGNCIGSSTGLLVPEVHKWIVTDTHDRFEWQVYFFVAAALTTAGGLVFLFFGKNDLQDFSKETKDLKHTQLASELPNSIV